MAKTIVPFAERFWANKTVDEDGCWIWAGSRIQDKYGNPYYGRLKWEGRGNVTERAHRVAYELATGIKPGELSVCHECDKPPCINPKCLFLGTTADNMRDKSLKERTPGMKLNYAKAQEIRELREQGVYLKDIAAKYGVHIGAIQAILNRRTFHHKP